LPGLPEINHTTINSWEDPEFRVAKEHTGLKKLLIAGLWTEVCIAFPALDALRAGHQLYVVADAIGSVSRVAHESAMQRMIQAGTIPTSVLALACELLRDWGDRRRTCLAWLYANALGKLKALKVQAAA
jgi:nicotinamidase-related amidase